MARTGRPRKVTTPGDLADDHVIDFDAFCERQEEQLRRRLFPGHLPRKRSRGRKKQNHDERWSPTPEQDSLVIIRPSGSNYRDGDYAWREAYFARRAAEQAAARAAKENDDVTEHD